MIKVDAATLTDGLRVVHHRDTSTAMVAVNVLYDVGARDEREPLTGLAHLFEHLMFGGSANVADFDGELQRAGGRSNAWTSNDFTNFYEIVPAHNAETAFWLESDRMLALVFNEKSLRVQKSVVVEEFKQQCLNQPYGDLAHHLRRLVYRVHPYRYPTIGRDFDDIERVTLDDVRRFFYSHYAPNNAVLAVSGNISLERTMELAEKWFGSIQPRNVGLRTYAPEPEQIEPRREIVTGDVPATDITIAYRMGGYGTRQYLAADLLTDLLANGESSLFYRRLLMGTDMFTSVDASITGSEEPGMLLLTARLTGKGDDAERRAIDAIHSTVDILRNYPVDERDITRAINRMDSATTFGEISYLAKAQHIAMCAMHGEDINNHVERYRSLTPDDIVDGINEIIRPEASSTIIYRRG